MPIGFRRNLRDHALVFAIGEGIHGNIAFLLGPEAGEVVLTDIEFDLLLTLMMTIWRSFYLDKGSEDSAQRLMTRHKVRVQICFRIHLPSVR